MGGGGGRSCQGISGPRNPTRDSSQQFTQAHQKRPARPARPPNTRTQYPTRIQVSVRPTRVRFAPSRIVMGPAGGRTGGPTNRTPSRERRCRVHRLRQRIGWQSTRGATKADVEVSGPGSEPPGCSAGPTRPLGGRTRSARTGGHWTTTGRRRLFGSRSEAPESLLGFPSSALPSLPARQALQPQRRSASLQAYPPERTCPPGTTYPACDRSSGRPTRRNSGLRYPSSFTSSAERFRHRILRAARGAGLPLLLAGRSLAAPNHQGYPGASGACWTHIRPECRTCRCRMGAFHARQASISTPEPVGDSCTDGSLRHRSDEG